MSLAKIGKTGRRHTDETKQRMSLVKMGRRHTNETKQKMSLVKTGAYRKSWVIRSPDNVVFSFENLRQWCHKNEHLFPPDKVPCRSPLWRRAVCGIGRQGTGTLALQWKGWVLMQVLGRCDLTTDRRPAIVVS